MIIEFFGPPAAGKTTFARELLSELRKQGFAAEMALEHAPEKACVIGGFRYALGRITGAIGEILAMLLHPIKHKDTFRVVGALLFTMPPRNPIWFVRIGQYLLRLSMVWRRSSNVDPIIILDQAFIQGVCSLAVFSRSADEKLLCRALNLIPKPDVAIRISVDPNVQKSRLHTRCSNELPMARLFEAADETNLRFTPAVEIVNTLLLQQHEPVLQPASVDSVVDVIAKMLASTPVQRRIISK